ncbi:hypothetical protein N8I77_010302 [Diaporthe amygdali]|uniref:Uncharacterized protein n=1 Tax=Phomopsis amygdali TaxID=1214568 RepID=A0AAD9S6Q2_PHOAM|nr:hypothetical protein N8I77_010302 [Diaporthe amygdali]
MTSQNDHDAWIQAEQNCSEDARSDRDVCETEQSVDGESSTLNAVEENISQTPNRHQEANGVARSESKKSIEAPAVVLRDLAKAEFPRSHKFSTLATSTFVLACLTVPCCVAFISFLWSNPNGTRNNETWLKIVLNDWVLKSITISTLILRAAISSQAAIATSMLACIIMETKGVALHRSAAVSALRYVNNGPQSLTLALRDTYSHAGPWALVTLLLYLTTFALQFGSTILVGDLAIGSLIDQDKAEKTSAALSWSAGIGQLNATRLVGDTSYWEEFLPDFPIFAENHGNPSVSKLSSGHPVRDTGTTLRAFIPLSNQSERTMLHSYVGMATVEDSRVICVRPKLHQYFSIGYESENLGYLLNGTLVPGFVPPGLILAEEPALTSGLLPVTYGVDTKHSSNSSVTLTWSQQIPFAHDAGKWAIAQNLMYFGPALVSSLDPRYSDVAANTSMNFTMENPDYLAWNLSYYQEGDSVQLMTGRSYELLNTTISRPENNTNMFFSPEQERNKLVINSQDEWLVFTIPNIPDFRLSVSLCFDSFASINAEVNVTSQQPSNEPSLGSWNASTGHLDTTQLRGQLGALPNQSQAPADRGIMSLETGAEDLRDQVQAWYAEAMLQGAGNISFPTQNFLAMVSKDTYSWGTWMCADCGMDFVNHSAINISYVPNNALQEQIFQDVVQTTGDTSRAWQAYYTILGRLAYYETLPYFDVEANVSEIQFPQSSRGLAAVCAMLFVHVGLIVLVTTAFLMKTRISRIGDNAWLNLVQADLAAMEIVFKASSTMKDGDVEKEVIVQGMKRSVVHIGKLNSA